MHLIEQTKIVMVGIILFVRERIPSKHLSTENGPPEGFCIELSMRKKKRLIVAPITHIGILLIVTWIL